MSEGVGLKAGELAVALGVARDTLYTWMKRPEIIKYFSPGAMGEGGSAHRIFNENDVVVFTTITHLRYVESVTDWAAIAAFLDTGQRYTEFPQNAISADPRTVSVQQAEVSAKAMATLAERDAALERVKELEAQLEKVQEQHRLEVERLQAKNVSDIERLLREMAELRYQIGKLERDKGE